MDGRLKGGHDGKQFRLDPKQGHDMAEEPQKLAVRPLSPFLTVYRWPITMATSIVHRMTGVALAGGMIIITWWLWSVANGPEAYNGFTDVITTPLGQVILFGFVWSLSYHTVNGIRHLAWDLGYGFEMGTANATGIIAFALSLVLAIAVFAVAWTGLGGFYQ
jgi:succinate dehydrogenase / fumarate reductase cytochrome b subunit